MDWKGSYSVKRGYHIARQQSIGQIAHSAIPWEKLWNLNIPNKVKVFGWRCLSGILPTRDNLIKKQVLVEQECPFCRQQGETTNHILLHCHTMEQVRVNFDPMRKCNSRGSLGDWFMNLVNNYTGGHVEEVLMAIWAL